MIFIGVGANLDARGVFRERRATAPSIADASALDGLTVRGQIFTREWQDMAATGRSDRGIDSEIAGAGGES